MRVAEKYFVLGRPDRSLLSLKRGWEFGGVLQHRAQITHTHTHTHTDPLIFPTDGLAKTYQRGTKQGTLNQYEHQHSQRVCRKMRCSFANHVN